MTDPENFVIKRSVTFRVKLINSQQAGFPAYKYVPFGPVDDVLPYLSRRCQENRSLLEGVKAERAIVKKELLRRLKRFNRY